jgi:hypothetical protein
MRRLCSSVKTLLSIRRPHSDPGSQSFPAFLVTSMQSELLPRTLRAFGLGLISYPGATARRAQL